MANKQHRLPASFMGGFGQAGQPARRRRVWVRRRNGRDPYLAAAESLNYERGVYDTPLPVATQDAEIVDEVWDLYEGRLSQAIDTLVAGEPLPIQDSLHTLVAFVACLCVRDGSFDDFIKIEYPRGVEEYGTRDWINLHRVALVPSIASRLLRCRWHVLRPQVGSRFITSDRGFTGGRDAEGDLFMWVPLRPTAGLELRRCGPAMWQVHPRGRTALYGKRDHPLDPDQVLLVNNTVAELAARECYGREQQDLAALVLGIEAKKRPFFGGQLVADSSDFLRLDTDDYWLQELRRADVMAPETPTDVGLIRLIHDDE